MFVLFREELIDSDEIRGKIQEEGIFKVEADLTKATKREDVMSFKLSIDVDSIDGDRKFDWDDDSSVEYFFEKAEVLTENFLEMFPKYTILCSSAYKWDEVDNTIKLVTVIANIDIKMKKLKLDILKRMLKQVD